MKHEWNALCVLYDLNHSSKWILTLDACGKIKKHCKKIYFRSSINITRGPNPRGRPYPLANLIRMRDQICLWIWAEGDRGPSPLGHRFNAYVDPAYKSTPNIQQKICHFFAIYRKKTFNKTKKIVC